MNYLDITHEDTLNGDGFRVTLWVSGCNCHCYNCQNPYSWNFKEGIKFDTKAKKEIFNELDKDYIQGLTLSGGHPLEKNNLNTITSLCEEVKEKYPNKDIWVYTGYQYEDIKDWYIMNYIDVLVDGKYIDEQRDISLKWRGSKNQRVINVPKSLTQNKVILWCD